VHPSAIYRLLKARQLPASNRVRTWRFKRDQIDEWRLREEADWDEKKTSARTLRVPDRRED